jgi:hypothetical protein
MELYKYCTSKNFDLVKSRGGVRIGSLSDYRRTDKYGELVGDALEGTKNISATVQDMRYADQRRFPGLRGIFELGPRGRTVGSWFNNVTVSSPDVLVFSASEVYDKETHALWRESAVYDVCYQIHSAKLFFRALTRALGDNYRFFGFGPVVYAKEFDAREQRSATHPAFVKRQEAHFTQREVRAVWVVMPGHTVESRKLEPQTLEKSEAYKYVSHYASV